MYIIITLLCNIIAHFDKYYIIYLFNSSIGLFDC